MKNVGQNAKNTHGYEFVSYIYGELDKAAQDEFETHLLTCDECAMELACFSDARLGVIEWRREDFDHLETPAIVVPWSTEDHVAAETHSVSVKSRFIEAISGFPLFAKAGLGFAAAAVAFGIFYIMAFAPAKRPEVAVVQPSEQTALEKSSSEVETQHFVASSENGPAASKVVNASSRSHNRSVVAVKATSRPTLRKNELATTTINKSNVTTVKKAPRLTTVEEEEDKSLRLADLFAEIGSSEE